MYHPNCHTEVQLCSQGTADVVGALFGSEWNTPWRIPYSAEVFPLQQRSLQGSDGASFSDFNDAHLAVLVG